MNAPDAADRRPHLHALGGPVDELEQRYGADTWHAAELGVPAARGRATVSFTGIDPEWLRDAAKAWARQRLVLNYAFNTVRAAALAFRRFSAFLHNCRPLVEHPGQIDRALIEQYLAWVAPLPLSEQTKALSRVFLRAFLEENRRYRWVGAIPLDAVIYHDELSARRASLPRFVPEPVMAQLESEANLERLTPHYRHLVVNACLTCPDFQTTVQFLPVHRRQAQETTELIERAQSAGHERLAANHRRVLVNLEKVICALEGVERDG